MFLNGAGEIGVVDVMEDPVSEHPGCDPRGGPGADIGLVYAVL